MTTVLAPLVAKALVDTGYDLIRDGGSGWTVAGISGSAASLMVRQDDEGVLLALPEPAMCGQIGLVEVDAPPPPGCFVWGERKVRQHCMNHCAYCTPCRPILLRC